MLKMNTLLVHTSNIINWKSVKNNPKLTSTDEVLKCSIQVIKCCMKSENVFLNNKLTDIELECLNHKDVILDVRSDLRINVKLFLPNPDIDALPDHLSQIFKYLDFNDLDSLTISLVPKSIRESISMSDLYAIWSQLELYVRDGRILQLGVCDLSLDQLKEMCQNVEVKPSINQIYSKRICSISQALKDFASDHHIQLLSHNDKPEIMPGSVFKSMLDETIPQLVIESVDPVFVCRYSVVFKNRNVIRSKGYISKVLWKHHRP